MTTYDVDHTDDYDDDDEKMTVMADGADWRVRLVDSSLKTRPAPLCTELLETVFHCEL